MTGEGGDAAPAFVWADLKALLEGAYATRTIARWGDLLADHLAWCSARGEPALPPRPAALAAQLAELFERQATSTVLQRIRYLQLTLRHLGLPDTTRDFLVELAVRRGRRLHGQPQRQAMGLGRALRDRMLAACPDDLLGRRNRVMLRVGYDALARPGELVEMRIEDLERLPDGAGRMVLRRSKTDPFGLRCCAFLSRETMIEVEAWLQATRLRSGPLLRGVHRGRRNLLPEPLDYKRVGESLRALAATVGVPASSRPRISGNSLRVGAAQDLAVEGRSLVEIMRAGRWSNLNAVSRYVQAAPVNVWADPPETPVRRAEGRLWPSAERPGAPALRK